MPSPIILFAYNRPEILRQTLTALSDNVLADVSELFIYCDGAKPNAAESDLKKIAAVKTVAREKNWCQTVHVVEREKNLGLAISIITGVSEIVNRFGKVIVMEDDIITSRYFLQFMNDALALYESEKKVQSIGACVFYQKKPEKIPFFLPTPDSLGWATWRDRWQQFEPDSKILKHKLESAGLIQAFDLFGNYKFNRMLQRQAQGKVSSWAIRWQAVGYLNNWLTLFPPVSLSNHQDSDNATHASHLLINPTLATEPIVLKKQPIVLSFRNYNRMCAGFATFYTRPTYLKPIKKLMYFFNFFVNQSKIKKYIDGVNEI